MSRCHTTFRMSSGELSFESPPSLHITWSIPDFFRLSKYSLNSPDFTFAYYHYCLRLLQNRSSEHDSIGIKLVNLTGTGPGRAVSYEVQLKSGTAEIDMDRNVCDNEVEFHFSRRELEGRRDRYVPNGTLTVLCSVRLRKPSSPNSGGAQNRVIPRYRRSGELTFESPPFLYVTWRTPGFFHPSQLSGRYRHVLESPEFLFSGRRYCLRLVSFVLTVDIELVSLTDGDPGRYVSYEVGLKSKTGEEIYIHRSSSSTKRFFYIFRSVFESRKSQCFPDDQSTVFCSVRSIEPSSAESPLSGGEVRTPGSEAPVPKAAVHPKSVGVQTSNEEEDKEGLPAINKVLKDLKSLLASGENSDVTLVVGGKEFPVHRNILCARSPVFKAMLCHKSERDSSTINISDCDPDGFQDFLTYVYTGSTGHIDARNVISLYTTSDKYLMSELKEACVSFMEDNMSVEGFCDIATLALRHDEKDLIESATKFFCENSKEITEMENWVTFLDKNLKWLKNISSNH